MKKPTTKQLKTKADKLFSIYIRKKYSVDGYVVCYTCGKSHPIAEIQCGHFISRVHLSTRWDEANARPQDLACNIWRRGAMDEFARNLVRECGVGILDELNAKKNEICKMTVSKYEALIDDLINKIAEL